MKIQGTVKAQENMGGVVTTNLNLAVLSLLETEKR